MIGERRENLKMRALYFLAILFVVDGHLPLQDLFDLGGLMSYYSFHLMLFAFGAGYFFRLHGSPLQDAVHRAKRLLLPLYAWNLFYGLLAAVLRRFAGFALGAPLSPMTLLLSPILDGEHFVLNLGAWYLFPLFSVQIIYAALIRVLGERKSPWLAFWPCLLAGIVAVVALQCKIGPVWLLRGIVLLPGYAGGVLYREKLETRDTLPTLPYLSGLIVLRAVLLLIFGRLSYLLSTGTYMDCGPIGVMFSALVGIAFWVRIAELIAPAMEKSRLAMAVSRHTLSVMMHHYMGFFCVNAVFLILNWMGIAAADFSVSAFRTTSGYVYVPGEAAGWTVVYLAAGLLLPLIPAILGEKIMSAVRRTAMDGKKR